MTKSSKPRGRGRRLAASLLAVTAGAGLASTAWGQTGPEGAWNGSNVIVDNSLDPNAPPPTGVLDNGVNLTGVGEINIAASPTVNSRFICSSTLINPRTILFAAHCVSFQPAESYGPNGTPFGPWTTGTPAMVAFEFANLPGVRQWFGLNSVPGLPPGDPGADANPALRFNTNAARNVYEIEQIWYDPRSLELGVDLGFLEADIALGTLDTHVSHISTWVLLFTPLTGPTHGVVNGYGINGTHATAQGPGGSCGGCRPLGAIDDRRRAAENMISFLGSLDDRDDWLFGPGPATLPQSLYQLDFDSPAGEAAYNPAAQIYDFDLFDGAALPGEGATSNGDSGGPLIADQYFADQSVVVGVSSGAWRFFDDQRFSTYGTSSFYQPLFLFWEQIVANNPYVYAANFDGNASWTDPSHWIQDMDPAYGIEVDGALVNGLPGTPAGGVTGATPRFGNVCFLNICTDVALDPEATPYNVGTPNSILIPGGPGTTNFVPDNVVANPAAGVRARYYDVTLSGMGITWLDTDVTIDRFTMDGPLTSLDVRSTGTLNVWSDFTVHSGFLEVDGAINSGEALLVQGIMTGSGTFNPTYLTSVDGVIAPGDLLGVGTLTVMADVVLASENELLIELARTSGDQLRVLADPAQGTSGSIALGGDLWLTPSFSGGGPRFGNVYTIVLADGAVVDTFEGVNAFLGILRPELTYLSNSVTVKLEAGSFHDLFTHNPMLAPFALALDELRENHYASLYNLYGDIDLMDPARLTAAFSSLAPASLMDARGLMAMQQSSFGTAMQDRLSLLARGSPGDFTVSGDPGQVLSFGGDAGLGAATELSLASMVTEPRRVASLPGGVSAFVTGGYSDARASTAAGRAALTADDSLRSWQVIGGVEQTMDAFTVGVAAGYSRGSAMQTTSSALAENDIAQAALYGVYRFGDGYYVSGLVGAGHTRTSTERRFAAGTLDYRMQGDMRGDLLLASLEAGVNIDLSPSFTLTPNASLRQYTMHLSGFEEGGGETALAIAEQSYRNAEARLGARLTGEHVFTGGWTLVPSLHVGAVANLAGDEGGMWARFALAPDVPFYLPGAARDDYWGEVAGGLRLVLGQSSFALELQTSVGREELYEDRYMARFAQRF